MNYETALKLKEVGFPQITFDTLFPYRGHYEALIDGRVRDLGDGTSTIPQENLVYIPTLEELIEGTGRAEFKLSKRYSAYENKIFYVVEIPGANDMKRCDTPTDAVAALYIALNSKPL